MLKKTALGLLACLLLTVPAPFAYSAPSSTNSIFQILGNQNSACRNLRPTFDDLARKQLIAFYQPHNFHPLWSDRQRLEALLAQFDELADDGLDPASYAPEQIRQLYQTADSTQLACADILTTHAYLRALRHLAWGRVDQTSLEPIWRSGDYAGKIPSLTKIAEQGLADPAMAFSQARPTLDLYINLRHLYARMRHEQSPVWPKIPAGSPLRPEMQDLRIPLLEQRLAIYLPQPDPAASDDLLYYPALVEAVKNFQRQHSLQPDGIIGPGTLAELNTSQAYRLGQLRINLERLRWIARDMEPDILLVNVAGARLIDYRNGQASWQTRTQVGRADRATPLLKSTVTRLTLNPTWTVPPTILREDKLPKIRRNPGYLARNQIKVLDAQGQQIDPNLIDWNNPQAIRLRQDAGPGNPLGKVVVRFANPFFVYLHDTPSQPLFARSPRAFSSGCVRVEGALKLADRLLTDQEREPVKKLLANGKSTQYNLGSPRPILITYWTAEADGNGQVTYQQDIYKLDRSLLAALNAARP
ncbi:L,D-transpeptidase family protein [Azomonas macrocytogenes]|uniref:L,D-transpeptidase family protein n=1 Tax=Azomonas macrocytogenes TaxID=69962 RepID=UPI001FECEE3C|nr:L,D-transpeptidase family protein [Azomonas macrocytogenes]